LTYTVAQGQTGVKNDLFVFVGQKRTFWDTSGFRLGDFFDVSHSSSPLLETARLAVHYCTPRRAIFAMLVAEDFDKFILAGT